MKIKMRQAGCLVTTIATIKSEEANYNHSRETKFGPIVQLSKGGRQKSAKNVTCRRGYRNGKFKKRIKSKRGPLKNQK